MLAITGSFDQVDGQARGGIAMLDTAGNLLSGYFEGDGCGGYYDYPYNNFYQAISGIEPAQDGGYFIYGAYHGYDDGTGTDGSDQRLLSKLYGLNVGISEHGAHADPLQIAPNPSAGQTVLSVGTPPQKGTLTIHDASGRMVWQEPWPAGAYTHTLQAGAWAPGTYVVRLSFGSAAQSVTGRLVVMP